VGARLLLLVPVLAACNGGAGEMPGPASQPDAATTGSDPQRPPQGHAALEAWLATGQYKSWTCEMGISNKRLNGAHGRQRICSNRLLMDSSDGPYPVGAASVKEMYATDDRPNGYAVGLKVAPGLDEDSWYWYERTGTSPTSSPVADGVGVKICGMECHAMAPRDHVYIRATE
jgi:hypothetical protein